MVSIQYCDVGQRLRERMNEPNASEVKRVVLSVEDDDSAYFLIRSALRDLGSGLELQHVENASMRCGSFIR